MLLSREGPILRPGTRSYARAWTREGAMIGEALLRLGHPEVAADFLRWYAPHQAADGNVPCAVDRNGPDWLPEHDSHGELIFAVMEYFRFTGDRAFLAELWPAVRRAVDYLETLRAMRLGPEFEAAELSARRGLLPESASHEGYLAHPVHSYWDDFWALQGYRDAVAVATILGHEDDVVLGDFNEAGFEAMQRLYRLVHHRDHPRGAMPMQDAHDIVRQAYSQTTEILTPLNSSLIATGKKLG